MARNGWSDADQAAADAAFAASPEGKARAAQEERDRLTMIQTGTRPSDGAKLLPGTVSPDYGGSQYGVTGDTSAYDTDVDRARRKGAEGQTRTAVQLDQTQANESRGLEMGALGMLRAQADGSAPSSSAILSQRANQNAVGGAAQQVTAAHGPGGRVAAFGAAGQTAGRSMLAGNAANADVRAGEISKGQGSYTNATGVVNAQDIGAATQNAQYEAAQRAMNEQRQQEFERRGWNTRNTESQAEDRYKRNTDNAMLSNEQRDLQRQATKAAEDANTMNVINTGMSGGLSAYMKSDERTKKDVRPLHMGSLAGLGKKY
jgi:hypothetical protein